MTRVSTTSALNDSGRHGFVVSASQDGERVFRRAMRHSRRVRWLRTAIPVVVVLILGATVLVRMIDPLSVLVRVPGSVEGVVISGTKITMAAPKLSGYTNDGRKYELVAHSAAQDVTKPSLIELNQIKARIETGDEGAMNISAKNGLFDRSSGMLTLTRDVTLKSTGGFEMYLDDAVINTGTSDVVSDKPVRVISQQTTLRADRFELSNGGEVINFIGGVVMNIPSSVVEENQPPAARR